jgi:hypothetical protein
LTNDDAKVLSPVLARSRLTCLDLSENSQLDYSGATALVKGLKSSYIRQLNLRDCNLKVSDKSPELQGLLDSLKALVCVPLSSDGSIDSSVCSSLCSLSVGHWHLSQVSEALLIRPP